MANHSEDHLAEFSNEIELLRASRPTLTGDELDRAYHRARADAEQPRTGRFLRSRLAVVATLAVGGVLTGGTGALALSGVALSGSASKAQYVTPPTGNSIGPPQATTGPGHSSTGPSNSGNSGNSGNGPGHTGSRPGHGSTRAVAPAQGAGPGEVRGAQEIEQVSAPSSQLPFTGYALFPIMAIGVALLGVGLIGHRRTRRNES